LLFLNIPIEIIIN